MPTLVQLILLFFAYSMVGWIIEVVGKYRQFHRFINRGFLTGPWLPIYGSGCVLITIAVESLAGLEYGIGTTFAISFVLCGVLEYMVSFVMEKRYHARWWDYSQKPMNLHGRIWIGNLILFGLGGVLVIHLANPVFLKLFGMISVPGLSLPRVEAMVWHSRGGGVRTPHCRRYFLYLLCFLMMIKFLILIILTKIVWF